MQEVETSEELDIPPAPLGRAAPAVSNADVPEVEETAEAHDEREVFEAEAAALARIERLEEQLADRRADAQRARQNFEANPTEKGHAARAVAEQKAANAERELEAARLDAAPALEAATVQRRKNAIASLSAELGRLRTEQIVHQLDGLQELCDEFAIEMRKALDAISHDCDEHNRVAAELEKLCEERPGAAGRTSVERLLNERINPELAKTHGPGAPLDAARQFKFHLPKTSLNRPYIELVLRQVRPLSWNQRGEGT